MPPVALQLCPFSEYLEGGLRQRFEVLRWFALDEAARAALLSQRAASILAVVSGGHLGVSNALVEQLPRLSMIAINGVGLDKVDLPLAAGRGIRVVNTPDVLTDDVADLAVGLVIALLRGIASADAFVRAGAWPKGDRPLARRVSGRRFGIVGLGRIGRAIAARLTPFGSVAYTGPRRHAGVPCAYYDDVHALARAVDVLIIACPANAATHHLVGASVLDALGPDGYLVNVSRGSIVDETALVGALRGGRIAGAALDVFEDEPHVPAALREHASVVLTPHVASATVEARRQMADILLDALDSMLSTHGGT